MCFDGWVGGKKIKGRQTCELFGLSDLLKHGLQLNGRWPGFVLMTSSCCLDSHFVRSCLIRNCSCFSSYQLSYQALPRAASLCRLSNNPPIKNSRRPPGGENDKDPHADIPVLIAERWFVVRVRRIFLDGSVFCVETVFEMSSVFKLLASCSSSRSLSLSLSSPPEQAAHINAT